MQIYMSCLCKNPILQDSVIFLKIFSIFKCFSRLSLGLNSPPDIEKITKLVDRYYVENDTLADCFDWQKDKLLVERERNKRELFRQLWEMRNQIYLRKIGMDAYFKDNAFIGYKKNSDLADIISPEVQQRNE